MRLNRWTTLAVTAALGLSATAYVGGAHAGAAPAGAAPAPTRLHLVLPLVTDVAGLTRFADAVTTPGSARYGRYAPIPWLARHFGATPSTRGRVVAYLRAHGATAVRVDATGQLVDARMDAASAARLFGTRLVVRSARTGHVITPAGHAHLPAALRGLVRGVIGLDTAAVAHGAPAVAADGDVGTTPPSGYAGPDPGATPSGCYAGTHEGGFTPNEYLDAYQYSTLQQEHILGQGERVALIEIDGFKQSDVRTFARCFGLPLPTIKQIPVGISAPLPAGGEATLDLEVLDAAAPELRAVDVYETSPGAADVVQALDAPLQSTGFEPQVISVSLGLCEAQMRQSIGRSGIDALEAVLKTAAAAGISVLGASGDFGSADCANQHVSKPSPLPLLAVNFPSSSPWVTSVGGTNFDLDAQNQIVSQVVWNDESRIRGSAGGGGFSRLFTRPSWQNGVIANPWRAQPDVAMLADVAPGYAIYCTAWVDCRGSGWVSFGGTSAATPLMAGGFALLDERLRREDHVALGLANPLLYRLGRNASSDAQVFYDVTSGSNDIGPYIQADQDPLGCCSTRVGYDAASGWGGVNLSGLAQAAVNAEPQLADVTMTVPGGQHPVASGGIYVEIGCSAGCQLAARAQLQAPGMQSFTDTTLALLVHRNTRRLKLLFTPSQANRLEAALRAHRRITATLVTEVVDSAGNIERTTPTRTLPISS